MTVVLLAAYFTHLYTITLYLLGLTVNRHLFSNYTVPPKDEPNEEVLIGGEEDQKSPDD